MDTPVTIGPISLPASVLAAIIAAIASIIGAGVSFVIVGWNTHKAAENSKALALLAADKNSELANHQNTLAKDLEKRKTELTGELDDHKNELAKELEAYKDTLTEKQAEKGARRDYVYDARKHLYQQYEPLLFQLIEHCENANARIYSLARTAKAGKLELHSIGWLSKKSYYTTSTIYYLLAPLVIVKLMQRPLTFVDLTVDPFINNQYLLAKQLSWSFTDDFIFAGISPPLKYDPNIQGWKQYREQSPEKYWRQGVPIGRLDKAVEACIKRDPDGVSRCMSFGEFEEAYTKQETFQKFDTIADIFFNFHPKTRPVLWRMLITQAHVNEALLCTREIKLATLDEKSTPKLAIKPLPEDDRRKLDWRQSPDEATDEDVLVQPFEVAHTYLRRENSFVRHLVEK